MRGTAWAGHARYLTVASRAEPAASRTRPSGMNTTPLVRFRGPLRTTALSCAALMSGAALLLAGCSASCPSFSSARNGTASGSAAGSVPAAAPGPAASGAPGLGRPGGPAGPVHAEHHLHREPHRPGQERDRGRGPGDRHRHRRGRLRLQRAGVDEPPGGARPTVSLQLKVPVAVYQPTLSRLSSGLGKQTALAEHAQDVTQQVADVSSLVSSAQDAITQLQALLKRAGSVSDLLNVQEQINARGVLARGAAGPAAGAWPGRPATRRCR